MDFTLLPELKVSIAQNDDAMDTLLRKSVLKCNTDAERDPISSNSGSAADNLSPLANGNSGGQIIGRNHDSRSTSSVCSNSSSHISNTNNHDNNTRLSVEEEINIVQEYIVDKQKIEDEEANSALSPPLSNTANSTSLLKISSCPLPTSTVLVNNDNGTKSNETTSNNNMVHTTVFGNEINNDEFHTFDTFMKNFQQSVSNSDQMEQQQSAQTQINNTESQPYSIMTNAPTKEQQQFYQQQPESSNFNLNLSSPVKRLIGSTELQQRQNMVPLTNSSIILQPPVSSSSSSSSTTTSVSSTVLSKHIEPSGIGSTCTSASNSPKRRKIILKNIDLSQMKRIPPENISNFLGIDSALQQSVQHQQQQIDNLYYLASTSNDQQLMQFNKTNNTNYQLLNNTQHHQRQQQQQNNTIILTKPLKRISTTAASTTTSTSTTNDSSKIVSSSQLQTINKFSLNQQIESHKQQQQQHEFQSQFDQTTSQLRTDPRLQQHHHQQSDCLCKSDPDVMFLMSLLPDIKLMSKKNKGKLKISFQQIIQDSLYPDDT